MFIQNISMADVIKGNHHFEPDNTVLIQIQDYGSWQFAKPAKDFLGVYQFAFDDHDDPLRKTNINDDQARDIAEIMIECYKNNVSIVVHCHAGICRSGAVAEAGIVLGFEDRSTHRIPNVLVKNKLFKQLGFTNSWE